MRINGRGRVVSDLALCSELAEGTKVPKTAIIVMVDEVLFHCGKAVNRAPCGIRHHGLIARASQHRAKCLLL